MMNVNDIPYDIVLDMLSTADHGVDDVPSIITKEGLGITLCYLLLSDVGVDNKHTWHHFSY